MVEISGSWFHIDPQLEDHVARDYQISYKYFLKGDEYFAAHHVWCKRLLNPDPHSVELPDCAESAPLTPAAEILQAPVPDVQGLVQQARKEQSAAHGLLSALEPAGELPPLPGADEAMLTEENQST